MTRDDPETTVPAPVEPLISILEALIEQYEILERLLADELIALETRELDAIVDAAARKDTQAASLALHQLKLRSTLGDRSVRDVVATVDHSQKEALAALHDSLRRITAACRHRNAVNGKVIHRSRQSTGELVRMLTGIDGSPVYTARGSKPLSQDGHALALA